jgi:hypothetical protein
MKVSVASQGWDFWCQIQERQENLMAYNMGSGVRNPVGILD